MPPPLFLLHCIQIQSKVVECIALLALLQLLHQLPSIHHRQAGTHVHASCVYSFIYLHIYDTSWLARKWMKKSRLTTTAWKEMGKGKACCLQFDEARTLHCLCHVGHHTLSTRNKNGLPTSSFQFHSVVGPLIYLSTSNTTIFIFSLDRHYCYLLLFIYSFFSLYGKRRIFH